MSFEPVLIVWKDSATLESGAWMSVEDVKRDAASLSSITERSVGFLIEETEHAYAICQACNVGDDHNFQTRVLGCFLIPKSSVLEGPTPLRVTRPAKGNG